MLDTSMLALFTVLMSWRLTGVSLHEWLGLALTALLLLHLVVHWGWVEARVAALLQPTRRRFGALLLNSAVFVAMGATIVSGLVVSKVVMPNHLTPVAYLGWHGLHESAATVTVLLIGLHLAFNWDRIRGAIQRLASSDRSSRSRGWGWAGFSPPIVARRLVWIFVASTVLTGAVWAFEKVTPGSGEVIMVYADGHQERRAPPPEITRLWPDANRPDPAAGARRFLMSAAVLLFAAFVGRRLLTMQRRRNGARGKARQLMSTRVEAG